MKRIFKKSFKFEVDNFEEWENQQCTSKGALEGEIYALVKDDTIIFKLVGMENLNIVDTFIMDLGSPYTQALESKGSLMVHHDRIQYFGGMSSNPNVPHICHLFCEYGRINYVRFAFPSPDSNPMLPITKRIYEFYGDMTELDDLSDESREMFDDLLPTETEQYVMEAFTQAAMGNEGDAIYHPLYKAWRSYQADPSQLQRVKDAAAYGLGLLQFLLFGTIDDIDIQQQIASISYMFLSKAIEDDSLNSDLYLRRLLLIQHSRNAFEYTVSSVVNEGADLFSMSMFPFTQRDALYKMEYADLTSNPALMNIDIFRNRKYDLDKKIQNNFFSGKDAYDVILEGKELHKKILRYIEYKVLECEDIDF